MIARTKLRPLVLALLTALLALGCHGDKKPSHDDDDDDKRHASASPSASASAAPGAEALGQQTSPAEIVDRDYKFRIKRPGAGFTVVAEADVGTLAPLSRGGIIGPKGIRATIAVDEAAQIDLDKVVDAAIARVQFGPNGQVEERAPTTFGGEKAIKYAYTTGGDPSGRVCAVTFVHQRFIFLISANAPVDPSGPRGCASFETTLAAFTLDPGQPVSRPLHATTTDFVGPGYRLHDGVFESATGGYRFTTPARAVVASGLDAHRLWWNADVVILFSDPEAVLAIRSDKIGVLPQDQLVAAESPRIGALTQSTPNGLTVTLPWLGADATGEQLDNPMFDYVFAAHTGGEDSVELVGWTPKGLRARALAEFVPFLSTVVPVEGDERKRLGDELAAIQIDDNSAEGASMMRRGKFVDFLRNVSWTRPSNAWDVSYGNAASILDPAATLVARERNAGVNSTIEVYNDVGSEKNFHDRLVTALVTNRGLILDPPDKASKDDPKDKTKDKSTPKKGDPATAKIGGVKALVSEGSALDYGISVRFRVATFTRGTSGVAFISSYRGDDQRPLALDFENGIGLNSDLITSERDGVFTDAQYGYSFSLGSSWKKQPFLDAFGPGIVARDGERAIKIATYADSAELDGDLANELAIAFEAGSFALDLSDARPTVTVEHLGSRTAKHFVYDLGAAGHLEAFVVRRDRLRYMVLARGAASFEEIMSAFKLVDDRP